jgi:hypothetical protein
MNTPIKPPGSTPFSQSPEPVADVTGTEKTNETFGDVLDELAQVSEVSQAKETAFDSVQAIADQLRTGEIDTPAALEKLVEDALQDLSISGLLPEEKLEIEKLLRAALQDDPTLIALAKDLERQEPIEK